MSRYAGVILVILVGTTLLSGAHYYLYKRLVRDVALPRRWRAMLSLALTVAAISIPLAMVLGRMSEIPHRALLVWPAFLWMGLLFFLFLLLVFGDGVMGIVRLAQRINKRSTGVEFSRRVFLARALAIPVAVGATALGSVAVASALRPPRLRRVSVPLPRLPKALDGLTIAQITDLHVGQTVRREFVTSVVERINALGPDLVVITGDLVDGDVAELRDDVAPLADLKSRFGTYFVTGNHEYYSGARAWIAHLKTLGMRVLRNERVAIGSGDALLDLVGVDDSGKRHPMMLQGHGADVRKAMTGADPRRASVLLAHQPKEVHAAAAHGIGLVLSGHTHGGQIWPWGYLVGLTQPYLSGLHRHQENTWIYVSCGTGYWGPPMRLATPAEITLVRLQCEGEGQVT